jgi:hypothetical protein
MLRIEVSNPVSARLRELRQGILPQARRQMINSLAREALLRTSELTPIRTGRTRDSWLQAAQQLDPSSLSDSSFNSSREGTATQQQELHSSSVVAGSSVPYVPFLEYGTRHLRPFAMVRRALQAIRPLLRQYFRLTE